MRTTLSIIAALSISGAAGAYAADMSPEKTPMTPAPITKTAPADPMATPSEPMTAPSEPMAKPDSAQNIGALLAATPETTSFVRLAKAAGIAETLTTGGPYTVFAPTNDAFTRLPTGKVEELMEPAHIKEAKMLASYHIVAGKFLASDIPMGETNVPTLDGGTIKLKKTAEGVWVNGAKVTATDKLASNGVVHEIDSVIAATATN